MSPDEAKDSDLVAEAGDDVLELHAGGAKADGRGVGDIVGDRGQPLFQRDLRGEGDVETVLHVLLLRTSSSAWRTAGRSKCRIRPAG